MSGLDEASVVSQHLYEKADYYVNNNAAVRDALTPEQVVGLFAARKQVLLGDCSESKPGFFESDDKKRKWQAWSNLRGTNGDDAVQHFVSLIAAVDPDWESWDGFPDTTEATDLDQSVTVIQAHFRRFQVMRQEEEEREREAAAMKLQAMARARLSRRTAGGAGSASPEDEEEEANRRREALRALWQLLLRGITVLKHRTNGTLPHERVLWLCSKGERLYIERTKRSDAQMEADAKRRGHSRGIFLRDISEVRSGCNSHVFSTLRRPANADRCMSLIGTERTIDIELPNKETRDELVRRFEILIGELQVNSSDKARQRWGRALNAVRRETQLQLSMADAAVILHFKQLLLRGIEILKHCSNGVARRRVLWLDRSLTRLYIDREKRISSTGVEKGIDIDDISEVRPGINSAALAGVTFSPALTSKCLTIVGSERSISLQLPSQEARDMMVMRLHLFVGHQKKQNEQNSQIASQVRGP